MNVTCVLHRAADYVVINRARRRPFGSPERPTETIWFDIRPDRMLFDRAQHFCSLAMQLAELGHPLAIVDRPGVAHALAKEAHGAALLSHREVHLSSLPCRPPADAFVFTDLPTRVSTHITVRVHIGSARVAGATVYPFPVAPNLRPHMAPAQLAKGRARGRQGKLLLFAEHSSSRAGRTIQATRSSQCHSEALADDLWSCLGDLCHPLKENLQTPEAGRPIVIGDAGTNPLQPCAWMELLSRFEFFVAPADETRPINHRLIEAMSVGTIPIVEHTHRLMPGLVDGENAIVYAGREGFGRAIQRVLSMDSGTIRRLRRNVIEYYDTHLQTEPLVRRLLMTARMRGGAVLSMPYWGHELDWPPALDRSPEADRPAGLDWSGGTRDLAEMASGRDRAVAA